MYKFSSIVSDNRVFVCLNDGDNYWSHQYTISNWLFDGVTPKATQKKGWFEIPGWPTEVKKHIHGKHRLVSYNLRPEFIPSAALPKEVDEDFFLDDDNEHLQELYVGVMEEVPESWESVDFSIARIAHVNSNWEFVSVPRNVQHLLIDEILIHEALLQDKPCHLPEQESFDIIREHIKQNIDPKVARISSNYDFCLTVVKIIPTVKPEPYSVCVNPLAKKPKYKTSYRNNKEIVAFECAPKAYGKYPIVEPFKGTSYADLNQNIQAFLKELMTKINQPLIECPHCEGSGVVLG
jgi:hypothetical protein